jgi:hypothetical protein
MSLSLSNHSVHALVDYALLFSISRSPLPCKTPSPEFEPSIFDTKEDEWSVKSSLDREAMAADGLYDMSKRDQLLTNILEG